MRFSFSDVENALARTHNIAESKRSAFSHRLKHLQRLGFPAGINTGRGRAATYGVGHLTLLGVALELMQLGLSPERSVKAIEEDLHAVAMAADMAARSGVPTEEIEFPIFLYLNPAALNELMAEEEGGDIASATFFYAGLGQVLESFQGWFRAGLNRMAFFSVSALLWDLATFSRSEAEDHVAQFYSAVSEWADPFIHNVDYSMDRPDQPYWHTLGEKD